MNNDSEFDPNQELPEDQRRNPNNSIPPIASRQPDAADQPVPAEPATPPPATDENAPPQVSEPRSGDGAPGQESKTEIQPVPGSISSSTSSLEGFHVRDVVDAQDDFGDWYDATIEAIDHLRRRVYVHYKYWTSRYDGWIYINSGRLAPPGEMVYRVQGQPVRPGMLLDVFQEHPQYMKYMHAEAKEVREGEVLVHFKKLPDSFDEWLPQTSYRLQPWGLNTRRVKKFKPPSGLAHYIRGTDAHKRAIVEGSDRYAFFTQALASRGLQVVPMAGDGNCLFRSVAHQVYGDPELHQLLREKAADYMDRDRDWFAAFVEGDITEYLSTMRRCGTWGDEPEIQAMCEMYNRPAEIWTYDPHSGAKTVRTFHNLSSLAGRAPIRLSFYGGGHYDSVVPTDHSTHLLDVSEAGRVEDAAITRAGSHSRVLSATDGDDAEAAALQQALRESRATYENEENIEMELLENLAAQEGWATAGGSGEPADRAMRDSDVEATQEALLSGVRHQTHEEQLQRAIEESRSTAQPLSEEEQMRMLLERSQQETRMTDDDQIQAAIEASRAEVAARGGSGSAAGAPEDEEEMLRRAMEASRAEAAGAYPPDDSDPETDWLRAQMADIYGPVVFSLPKEELLNLAPPEQAEAGPRGGSGSGAGETGPPSSNAGQE